MFRKCLTVLLILFSLLPLWASAAPEKKTTEGLRVVSLAPNITEILYGLGAGDEIVGRTDYCNYPDEVSKIPSIGTLYSPNLEKIISLRPDIVIASSIVSPDILSKLEQAGIKTYQFLEEYNGIEGAFELVRKTGEAVGHFEQAEKIITKQKEELRQIHKKVSGIKDKKRCAFIVSWGANGDFAATGDTFIGQMIEAAGGLNAAKDAVFWSWSKEGIVASDPQVVFITKSSNPSTKDVVSEFKNTQPYNLISASKESEVILVDEDAFQRQGIRTVQSIGVMAKYIYPELFK